MKNIKIEFLSSMLTLVVCCVMFLGNTYAWFTDSVTSGQNIIVAGTWGEEKEEIEAANEEESEEDSELDKEENSDKEDTDDLEDTTDTEELEDEEINEEEVETEDKEVTKDKETDFDNDTEIIEDILEANDNEGDINKN
jgi:predicted ribosomally synthesized peptide with SipW-like signal peptide